MTAARYAPGEMWIAASENGVVVLSRDASEALALAAWRKLHEGGGIVALIDVLAAGQPLSALPAFAIVVPEAEGWRAAVRGGFSLTRADGTRIDTGANAPWAERSIPDAAALTIAAAGAAVEASLPLSDGVARVGAVVVSRSGVAAAPHAGAASAPVEPVQPHTVAEVHDIAADDAAAPEVEESDPAPAPAPESEMPETSVPGITDSIPEHLRPARTAPPIPPPPPLPVASDALGDVEATAVRGAPASDDEPGLPDGVEETVIRGDAPGAAVVGDHDGETLSLEEARRLRASGQLPPAAPAPTSAEQPPATGRAVLSTGQSVVLDRILVVGRRPRSTRATGTLPHLIAVDSPQQDISRNHLELRPESDSILATDLDTTNGTTLRRPGADPVKLHPGEPTIVVTGDVLDLGEGITVSIEAPA